MRAFLAIPIQPPALADFQDLRRQLVASVPGVRWAPADSPHITLHFFGTISAGDTERALDALRPVLRAQSRMRLHLHRLGSFPPAAPARVLWCGVEGDLDALQTCARACMDALAAAGFPVEQRRYRAHCTLGRPRPPWPADARESWQQHIRDEPHTAAFSADHAILFESVTGSPGVRHVPRAALPLAPVDAPSPPLTADAARVPRCGSGTARELR